MLVTQQRHAPFFELGASPKFSRFTQWLECLSQYHGQGLFVLPLPQGVFIFGMSEGAVTLSTFNDEYFASMIRHAPACFGIGGWHGGGNLFVMLLVCP
jgi:hypothetical protein